MIKDLHGFLHDFFQMHDCDILESNDGLLSVQLTRELDEALMNRPFYWHYMDKMNQAGEPYSLHLDVNEKQQGENREWIHFGSPRLQQIFRFIDHKAKYTVLYEKRDTQVQEPLYPWLIANLKVNYFGLQKKEKIFSIGLHLIHGGMLLQVMDRMQKLTFEQRMSDYTYTISPIIRPVSGFNRIFNYIENSLESENLSWVDKALQALEEEVALLQHFYYQEDSKELFEQEKGNIQKRLSPYISIEVINAGVFYLSKETESILIEN